MPILTSGPALPFVGPSEQRCQDLRRRVHRPFVEFLRGEAANWVLNKGERIVGNSAQHRHCLRSRFKRLRADGNRRNA